MATTADFLQINDTYCDYNSIIVKFNEHICYDLKFVAFEFKYEI